MRELTIRDRAREQCYREEKPAAKRQTRKTRKDAATNGGRRLHESLDDIVRESSTAQPQLRMR